MKNYISLLKKFTNKRQAPLQENRTGVPAYTITPVLLEFKDVRKKFPLLTLRKLSFNSIITELIWFLRGDTNIKFLHDHNTTIWDEWADQDGELGPIYGKQWRDWDCIDQIAKLVYDIKNNPSRRMILSAWNVSDIDKMKLPPCHLLSQFFFSRGKLCCHVTIRSSDVYLGLPYNIASYAALLMLMAKTTNKACGDLYMTLSIPHLYENHYSQALELIERSKEHVHVYPTLVVPKVKVKEFSNLVPEDFKLDNYFPLSALPAEVAI